LVLHFNLLPPLYGHTINIFPQKIKVGPKMLKLKTPIALLFSLQKEKPQAGLGRHMPMVSF